MINDVETATKAARHAENPAQQREAYRIAADLYFLLRTFTKRIGRTDLSLLAADRGLRAAEDADDPLRIAAARWNFGQVLLTIGEPEVAEEVTIKAAEELRTALDRDLGTAALFGALWLVAAIAAARNGDTWTAREPLRLHAQPAAARSGQGNVLWTVFGPVNVSVHAVSIEMEAGEASEALRLADNIDVSACPSIERRRASRWTWRAAMTSATTKQECCCTCCPPSRNHPKTCNTTCSPETWYADCSAAPGRRSHRRCAIWLNE